MPVSHVEGAWTRLGLILTDVTKGEPGNGERVTFVFDTRKVRISDHYLLWAEFQVGE